MGACPFGALPEFSRGSLRESRSSFCSARPDSVGRRERFIAGRCLAQTPGAVSGVRRRNCRGPGAFRSS
eukprot:2330713-Alexandrium_andersonii.AAC.2